MSRQRTVGEDTVQTEVFEDGAAGFDALPDEILVLVFSNLTDGVDLLDGVAPVCKRWHRLARDPKSWARVELTVGAGRHDGGTRQEARVLLHAPAAKSLVVEMDCLRDRPCIVPKKYVNPYRHALFEDLRRCASALRRSRAVVSECVSILHTGWKLVDAGSRSSEPCAIAAFLSRQRGLRDLRLYLSMTNKPAVLSSVAGLRRLEKVKFVVERGARYRGELAAGLPALRELSLHAPCVDGGVPCLGLPTGSPAGLIGDLVRGAKALRVLRVDMPRDADLQACGQLRALEHIEINVFEDVIGCDPQPALRRAWDLCFQVHDQAPGLRSAVVFAGRGLHAMFPSEVVDECVRLMQSVYSASMPRVEMEMVMNGPGQNWPGRASEAEYTTICDECEDSRDLKEFDSKAETWLCPGTEIYGYFDLEEDEYSDEDDIIELPL